MILSIVHAIQTMSFTQCIIVVPAFLAIVVMVLPRIRVALGIEVNSDLTASASEAFGAIALFFVFMTASSLTTVQGFQKDGLKIVETEVAHITDLDRELVSIGGPKAEEVRVALKGYLNDIIEKEWKELANGNSSDEVDLALGRVIAAVHHFKESGAKEKDLTAVEARLEQVSDSRDERIEVANEHLSMIYWGIIFGFLLMLMLIAFFSDAALPKRVGLAGKMVALAFALVLVIQTDGVFSGDVSVQPTLYKKALEKMKVRNADSAEAVQKGPAENKS